MYGAKGRAFRGMVTDDAKYDLKSTKTDDGTPFYAAIVIGEWSFLNGTLRRYDDYGNISYGIFGKAAGFSDNDLYEGSNLNQSFKNFFGSTSESGDENRDVYMIETGIHNAQFLLKKQTMRLLFLVSLLMFFVLGCSSSKVSIDNLQMIQSRYYLLKSSKPYTGKVVFKHDNGNVSNFIEIKDGVPEGKWVAYGYKNEKVQEGSYKPIDLSNEIDFFQDSIKRLNVCPTKEGEIEFTDVFFSYRCAQKKLSRMK